MELEEEKVEELEDLKKESPIPIIHNEEDLEDKNNENEPSENNKEIEIESENKEEQENIEIKEPKEKKEHLRKKSVYSDGKYQTGVIEEDFNEEIDDDYISNPVSKNQSLISAEKGK